MLLFLSLPSQGTGAGSGQPWLRERGLNYAGNQTSFFFLLLFSRLIAHIVKKAGYVILSLNGLFIYFLLFLAVILLFLWYISIMSIV